MLLTDDDIQQMIKPIGVRRKLICIRNVLNSVVNADCSDNDASTQSCSGGKELVTLRIPKPAMTYEIDDIDGAHVTSPDDLHFHDDGSPQIPGAEDKQLQESDISSPVSLILSCCLVVICRVNVIFVCRKNQRKILMPLNWKSRCWCLTI